jgi:hypothetical protein
MRAPVSVIAAAASSAGSVTGRSGRYSPPAMSSAKIVDPAALFTRL